MPVEERRGAGIDRGPVVASGRCTVAADRSLHGTRVIDRSRPAPRRQRAPSHSSPTCIVRRRLVAALLAAPLLTAACRSATPPLAPAAVAPAPSDAAPVAPPAGSAFSGDTLEWVVVAGGRVTGRMRQWGDTGFTTVTAWVPRARGTAPCAGRARTSGGNAL